MDLAQRNIRNITDYFREGCKESGQQKIGIEIEHFVIKKEGRNATYEEVAKLLAKAFSGEECYYEQEALISVKTAEYIISLEPAAQLEISINPRKDVGELRKIYQGFLKRLRPFLQEQNMELQTYGYQPYGKAAQLPLIPKKRYEYMDAYFKHTDTMGIRMMRGTASTQIAVDYCDEEDFTKKYQLAQMLSPLFYLLCENSPVVEGTKKTSHSPRAVIWNHVDGKRCGIVPGSMSGEFSFYDYAEYVYHVPLIFVEEQGNPLTIGEQSAADYYRERMMNRDEIEHMLSMVFPDVRLKNYIEIRMADSLPEEAAFAYAQLVQDIFYGDHMMELRRYLGDPTEEEIVQAKLNIISHGEDGLVYGRKAGDIFDDFRQIFEEPMLQLSEQKNIHKNIRKK